MLFLATLLMLLCTVTLICTILFYPEIVFVRHAFIRKYQSCYISFKCIIRIYFCVDKLKYVYNLLACG